MDYKEIDAFKNEQIEVWKEEQKLANNTQSLLYRLLVAMSEEELALLNNGEHCVSLDEYSCIEEITSEGYTDNFGYSHSLEEMNQSQQKQVIDTILLEIFKV